MPFLGVLLVLSNLLVKLLRMTYYFCFFVRLKLFKGIFFKTDWILLLSTHIRFILLI